MKHFPLLIGAAALTVVAWSAAAGEPAATNRPPFAYVWGKAYHVLPQTHSDESGYFSLCEGRDGRLYVGTAKYGQNAYLVQFDPATETQRIVIDTHQLCGLTNTGYAAQAKIHTRNFVGASGTIYVGSKQGYRRGPEDTAAYPGGYVMTYDPAADRAECLGMPYPGQGVIDVTADESRGLIYIVTCEDQHWMLYEKKTRKYRELGPTLTGFATVLLDDRGRANVLTRDFQLAQYDPATDRVTVRDIVVAGRKLTAEDFKVGPMNWVIAADGRTAYLIRLSEPSLFRINLASTGSTVSAVNLGRMIEGKTFDARGALSVGPDGRVYALVRVDNQTGFGGGHLHHLVRYDPRKNKMHDLGVLAVVNPDFYGLPLGAGGAIDPGTGKARPWTHGYQRLPDGTLSPLLVHLALVVAHDGTVYATILYPFTLLRIPAIP